VLSFIINIIVKSLAGFTIMNLTIGSALIMMLLSVGLTVLSGIIPSRKAAKQDPVVALRTE
jgi:putative ABC transport system permease protein